MGQSITGCNGCYWLKHKCRIRQNLREAMEQQGPADFHIKIEECGSRRQYIDELKTRNR